MQRKVNSSLQLPGLISTSATAQLLCSWWAHQWEGSEIHRVTVSRMSTGALYEGCACAAANSYKLPCKYQQGVFLCVQSSDTLQITFVALQCISARSSLYIQITLEVPHGP